MPVHLEEFLYRGRPEGGDEPPAWHVVLLSVADDGLGGKSLAHKTLSMAQAEEAGWPLPTIIDAINTDALKEIERLRREGAAKDAEIERLIAANPAAEA
jgi:hypothetical protein